MFTVRVASTAPGTKIFKWRKPLLVFFSNLSLLPLSSVTDQDLDKQRVIRSRWAGIIHGNVAINSLIHRR